MVRPSRRIAAHVDANDHDKNIIIIISISVYTAPHQVCVFCQRPLDES